MATVTPQQMLLVHIAVRGCVDTQGHSVATRIMSVKNSNDIGYQTHNLLASSSVPQPTVLPRAPFLFVPLFIFMGLIANSMILELKKIKAVLLQAWSGREGSRKLRFPDFMTTAQDGGKVVSLTQRPPLPPGNTSGTHFC